MPGLVNSQRFSVGSTYKNGWFVIPLIFGGFFALGELFTTSHGVCSALAAVCFLAAFVAWVAIFFTRRWLRIDADGFEVDGPGVKEAWRDVQVEQLSWSIAKEYSRGIAKSESCRLVVWNGQGRKVTMAQSKPLESSTPFTEFAARVFENLRGRMKASLEGGGRVSGDGWNLDRDKLTWNGGEVRVAEMSGAAEFDGQVRVWKKGSNDAAFGVPVPSANAILLKVLVEEFRPKQEGTAGVESGDDLGKTLFERPGGQGRWMLYLLGILLLLIGFLAFSASVTGGLALTAIAAALFGSGWWQGGLMFRCHEWGVSRRTRRGTTTIRYRDIAAFTSKATRHFVNGAYTGTTLSMEFRSRPELGGERIRWSASLRGMDEEMDNLRNHISKVIAARWIEWLRSGKSLPWTENLRLLPDGVEYRPGGLLGRKDWLKAGYDAIAQPRLQQGTFFMYLKGKDGEATRETVAATNFFPGFYVLMLVLQSGEKAESGPND